MERLNYAKRTLGVRTYEDEDGAEWYAASDLRAMFKKPRARAEGPYKRYWLGQWPKRQSLQLITADSVVDLALKYGTGFRHCDFVNAFMYGQHISPETITAERQLCLERMETRAARRKAEEEPMKEAQEMRRYRLNGRSPLLGSWPAQEDIRTKYLLSKCPDDREPDDPERDIDYSEEEERGLTVFPRDAKTGNPVLLAHQLKGFFKEALNTMDNGIAMARKKADNYLFIEPARMFFYRDGKPIAEEDDRLQRPLRGNVLGREHIALAESEMINDPWSIEFSVMLYRNKGTAKSKALTWEAIEDALDYGFWKGLLVWRNGGYGKFDWERIDENSDETEVNQ